MARIVFTPMSAEAWALNSKAKTLNGAITVSELTSGRVVFVGTGGLLVDDADFTFAVDTLTVTKIAAHSVTGDLTMSSANILLGVNLLKTTNLALTQLDADTFAIRNAADTAYKNLYLNILQLTGILRFEVDAQTLSGPNADNNYLILGARDNTNAIIEVARLAGAADPYFSAGGSQEFKFTNAGSMGLYGVTAVARSAGWTITNDLADRAFDADTVAVAELADVVATLITDLAATGIIGASA